MSRMVLQLPNAKCSGARNTSLVNTVHSMPGRLPVRRHCACSSSSPDAPSETSTLQAMLPATGLAAAAIALSWCSPEAAAASQFLREEPSNALSLPTWAIHVSSVVEWTTAMGLMWQFAEVSKRPYWKAMTWAMIPSLGSAMCACSYHFFYNAPALEWLVALQAGLTLVGNFTLWAGAYHVYVQSEEKETA